MAWVWVTRPLFSSSQAQIHFFRLSYSRNSHNLLDPEKPRFSLNFVSLVGQGPFIFDGIHFQSLGVMKSKSCRYRELEGTEALRSQPSCLLRSFCRAALVSTRPLREHPRETELGPSSGYPSFQPLGIKLLETSLID